MWAGICTEGTCGCRQDTPKALTVYRGRDEATPPAVSPERNPRKGRYAGSYLDAELRSGVVGTFVMALADEVLKSVI